MSRWLPQEKHPPIHRPRSVLSALCRAGQTVFLVVCASAFSNVDPAYGQHSVDNGNPVELRAEVNASQVREGDIFQLDFELTIRTSENAESFKVPTMEDFEVVRSQRAPTSSQTTIINGRRSTEQRTGFTYLLRAKTPGNFLIRSASVKVNGRTYRSEPIEIEVVKRGSGNTGLDSTALDPGARFGGGNRAPAYFLDVRFEKDRVYVGEQVVLAIQLYAREQTEIEINDFSAPKPNGFWVEVLDSPNRVRPTQRSVGDETFLVYPLMKIALFPLEAGEQQIESLPIGISVSRGGFWGRRQQMTLTSEVVRLTVLPLPEEDRPRSFVDGNVGRFELRATTDKRQVPLGQPVTFRLSVKGEGNIGALSLPIVPNELSGARIFPPSTKESKSTAGARIHGEKLQEVLMQPTREGRFVIPSFQWTYFDPAEARFIEERTRPIEIDVLPSQVQDARKLEGPDIGRQIRPFRTRIQAEATGPLWTSPMAASVLLATWIVSVAIAAFGIRRRRFWQSAAGREKQAQDLRLERMQVAQREQNLGEIERVLLEALSASCGDDIRALPSDALGAGLRSAGLPVEIANRCGAFFQATQATRYAPDAGRDAQRLSSEGMSLLVAVEAWEK